jgi:hypothetical protein
MTKPPILHYFILGAATILPGAFCLLFLLAARRVYRRRLARGKVVPWQIRQALL